MIDHGMIGEAAFDACIEVLAEKDVARSDRLRCIGWLVKLTEALRPGSEVRYTHVHEAAPEWMKSIAASGG